jgi:hypothetical protein
MQQSQSCKDLNKMIDIDFYNDPLSYVTMAAASNKNASICSENV